MSSLVALFALLMATHQPVLAPKHLCCRRFEVADDLKLLLISVVWILKGVPGGGQGMEAQSPEYRWRGSDMHQKPFLLCKQNRNAAPMPLDPREPLKA